MFAIVRTGGKQYRVAAGDIIAVEKLVGEAGYKVTFDDVLLAGDGDKIADSKGLKVTGEIVAQEKGEKVIIFKKRRRHNYRRKNGHRQHFTKISIDSIGSGVASRGVKMASAAPVQADDLTKIEGIGPKISELLQNAGVNTFADLAGQSEDALKAILKEGGSRFAMKNPSTWAKQADMAANGQWDELKTWQDILDGGIEK